MSGRHDRRFMRTVRRAQRWQRRHDLYEIGRLARRYNDQGGDEPMPAWPRPPLSLREWIALRRGYCRGDR